MKKTDPVPYEVGPIHFVGIGGIGMSGIAEVMLNLGYEVHGSDIKENANVERLRKLGATIHIGHAESNVSGAGAVVVSTAVKPDNPEVVAAREHKIPVVRRAEMLAELMRLRHTVAVAGTHGKTTTTSMVAALMDVAGFDPTVINGGIINAYGANAKLGEGDWMVVEADESDGSFLRLRGTVAIVTNIDPEHMDHYGSFDNLRAAFDRFVETIPFYGFAVVCVDHPEVQNLASRVENRRLVTYGFNPQAQARIVNMTPQGGVTVFDLVFHDADGEVEETWKGLRLPMAGRHNVQNATAAATAVRGLGGTEDHVRDALNGFAGVKRRFTDVGGWNGARVIDDYGHHPVEISAVLKAARDVADGKVIAVVQPHRYSRLHDLFDQFCNCFNDADAVLVAPVYEAGEKPIEGADRDSLVKGLRKHGHRKAMGVTRESLAEDVAKLAGEGDLVVCLGAGDITYWAAALPGELKALDAK
ncbi:UDP-N-acetylmuramate--L-alanine ligase [Euryhalocaulis caribicus]|uniref:UDP-N-acetylmuramate--L-alanine ligase n=1 Tax=Euryhalocaulis caribicus TaxID=1161401 RepID=UPI00039B9C87|nr:UDP-N-acetylmuramate--L-alanine ligase [Euryhalocaulis caribicus]